MRRLEDVLAEEHERRMAALTPAELREGIHPAPRPKGKPPRRMTAEERAEVLRLGALGLSSRAIARAVGADQSTVCRHLRKAKTP